MSENFYCTGDYWRSRIFESIDDERERQDAKWGTAKTRFLPLSTWLVILTEEVGEVAQAILKLDRSNLQTELIHVAAVAIAMIEFLDTSPFGVSDKDAG